MKKPERSWLILVFWVLFLTAAVVFFIPFFSNFSEISPKPFINQTSRISERRKEDTKCDLFTGQWVRDMREPLYSNWSCPATMLRHNCVFYGKDAAFINWRWKPDQCELPRFDPKAFLSMVRGKTMAFIGDSLARNQLASLLCLLTQAEAPIKMYVDAEGYFQKWYFQTYDFTLKLIWSRWLVMGEEKIEHSDVFHLNLDKVDEKWSKQLPDLDYIIISGTPWFIKKLYLYDEGFLLGCIGCDEADVTKLEHGLALRMAFHTALKHIANCKNCKGLVAWVRTSSPSHFEGGTWKDGRCNRTSPLSLSEAKDKLLFGGSSGEFRRIQVEETEKVKKKGEQRGVRLGVMDVTNAMYMRADAHPDIFWTNHDLNGYVDCVHWCLPGPIDSWNDLLLEMMKKEHGLPMKGLREQGFMG